MLTFDLGIGSLRNHNSLSVPFSTLNHLFFTHLHMDHMSDLPYFTMFRPIQGGWTPIHIYGPSGSEPQYGIAHMIGRMLKMTEWHRDSFNDWPIRDGFDPVVHEFDFMDEGGVAYEGNGVKITHWPTSHTPGYGLGYICKEAQPKVCVATHYDYDDIFNNEVVAQVRHHFKGAFAFGAPDLVTFNIHGEGQLWWREVVAGASAQTPSRSSRAG